jgi:adenylosuccinate synthase
MGITAVIGLQWGDEGKGKVVDAVCQGADVVVRCQGGANAGHTVVVGEDLFILHIVPSGILTENILCLIGNGVVVDLEVLKGEIEKIEAAGFKTAGRLLLSTGAHVVLPIHKRVEAVQEEKRGDRKLDTTKRGIGPCYSDKYARLGIRVADLLEPATLAEKVSALCGTYRELADGEPLSTIDENLEHCLLHTDMVKELAGDTGSIVRRSAYDGKTIILEGSQGFLLDVDHGTYPFVTSSNTGIHGLANGAGLAPADIGRVLGVAKAYTTRVGQGPLPTLMEEPFQTLVREKGKEFGATTGRPRRCGWLDLSAIRYACKLNGVTSLAVTKLDTLAGLEQLRLCEGYESGGAFLDTFPADIHLLENCTPRYTATPSWGEIDGLTDSSDLPTTALRYLERIQEAAACGLDLISIGPGREQLIRVES